MSLQKNILALFHQALLFGYQREYLHWNNDSFLERPRPLVQIRYWKIWRSLLSTVSIGMLPIIPMLVELIWVLAAVWPLLGLPAWLLGQGNPKDHGWCTGAVTLSSWRRKKADLAFVIWEDCSSLGLSSSWLACATQRGAHCSPLLLLRAVTSCVLSSPSTAPSYGPGTPLCRELHES